VDPENEGAGRLCSGVQKMNEMLREQSYDEIVRPSNEAGSFDI
jgi:hypothetical protein